MQRKQQAIFKHQQQPEQQFKLKKYHVSVALLIIVALFLFSFSKPNKAPMPLLVDSVELTLPQAPVKLISAPLPEETVDWKIKKVKSGETLSSIFDSMELSQSELYKIVNTNKDSKKLTKIYPGAELKFAFDDANKLSQLKYEISESEILLINAIEDAYNTEIITLPTETHIETANGLVSGSLFLSGKKAGLSDSMIMKLANIFAWDIDFVLDIRNGDSYSLIFEKIYQNGDFLRNGKIIAASFTNQGKTYQAAAFDDGDGFSYYNPEGRNMKKAFLRAPLNFSYISSNFNPKRFHPVQKRVKPHRGIDYSAPRGTPVYSAGNGKVIKAGYNKYNGNYVFIQHNNNIVTKYLHFTKRKVKTGQRVKQGQTIGTVGATGMVTGAHLHYEFLLNGVHRNPRTVKLPKATPLAKNKINDFLVYAKPLFSQLESINLNWLAKTKEDKSTKGP